MRRYAPGARDAEVGDGIFRAVATQNSDPVARLQPLADQGVCEAVCRAVKRAVIEALVSSSELGLVDAALKKMES